MKRMLYTIVLVLTISSIGISGKLPIEYQIQKNYHRIKLVLNGDVRWNVSQSEKIFDITLMGNESHFVIKNINYNFRDGIIKRFNYKTTLEGTKKIVVELRNNVNDYHIYQDEANNNLYIEFYPGHRSGGIIAKKISDKKTVTTPKKQEAVPQAKQNVVNIPQLVLDQVEQQPKSESEESGISMSSVKSGSSSSAALWLILVSLSILLTGGGFTMYAFLQRKTLKSHKTPRVQESRSAAPEFRTILEHHTEPVSLPRTVPGIVMSVNDEETESPSTEFAEHYVRSYGEMELQSRLESMSARSTQQKIAVALPTSKKKDPTILAQKLGLSVGELELVTRLQQFHKQHSSEVL